MRAEPRGLAGDLIHLFGHDASKTAMMVDFQIQTSDYLKESDVSLSRNDS
jgi:hypothetical protein